MTITINGSGTITGSDRASAGANSDVTSLSSLVAINNGPLAGTRNRLINGTSLILQRTLPATLSLNGWVYGIDRFAVNPANFTTATGSVTFISGTPTSSGNAQEATLTTTGTGTVNFEQRVESVHCFDLNSKTVTLSLLAYQDTGAAVLTTLVIQKATAINNFATRTVLGTSSATSLPSGVWTKLTFTITLGSSDAANGIACQLNFNIGAVTSKHFTTSDWQLEEGSVATEIEFRHYSTELSLCKRYYSTLPLRVVQTQTASGFVSTMYGVSPNFRVTPGTPTLISTSTDVNVSGYTLVYSNTYVGAQMTATAAGTVDSFRTYAFNAEI